MVKWKMCNETCHKMAVADFILEVAVALNLLSGLMWSIWVITKDKGIIPFTETYFIVAMSLFIASAAIFSGMSIHKAAKRRAEASAEIENILDRAAELRTTIGDLEAMNTLRLSPPPQDVDSSPIVMAEKVHPAQRVDT